VRTIIISDQTPSNANDIYVREAIYSRKRIKFLGENLKIGNETYLEGSEKNVFDTKQTVLYLSRTV